MNEQSVPQTLSQTRSWLLQHERLIIVALVLSVAGFGLNKALDIQAKMADNKVQVAEQQLNQQKQTDAQLLQAAQNSLTNTNAIIAAKDQQINSLLAAVANRNQVLTVQQSTDKSLPPTQLASRWSQLIGNSGVQNTQDGFAITEDAAVTTVLQLEQLPVVQANLKDEETVVADKQNELDSAMTTINDGKSVVAGLQKELTDAKATGSAQLKACQVAARKSKFKWFGIGVVVGFIGGHIW
jgi:hypothetical protein